MTPPLLPLSYEGLLASYGEGPVGVRVNLVLGLDGATSVDGRTAALSNPADQLLLHHLRATADAVLVGAGTARAERYAGAGLTEEQQARRRDAGRPAQPRLAVLAGDQDLPATLPIFSAGTRPLVLTVDERAEARRTALSEVADVLTVPPDPAGALAALAALGLRRVVCEGGPTLLRALSDADLVDEVCLTVSPLLSGAAGSRSAPGPVAGGGTRRLRLLHVLARDDVLYLRYARDR